MLRCEVPSLAVRWDSHAKKPHFFPPLLRLSLLHRFLALVRSPPVPSLPCLTKSGRVGGKNSECFAALSENRAPNQHA